MDCIAKMQLENACNYQPKCLDKSWNSSFAHLFEKKNSFATYIISISVFSSSNEYFLMKKRQRELLKKIYFSLYLPSNKKRSLYFFN